MSGGFTANETVNTLKTIFEKHKNERICVIGTMCCGKTTLIKRLSHNCIDMDDEFWPQISEEEIEVLSQTPITKEIFDSIRRLMYEKITVKPSFPLFGVVILDCEVVVYLDISEKLLEEHCRMRGDTNFMDALFVKKCVEEDWNNHKAKNEKMFYYLTVTE
jgi:GTPase SAR1 family protein